VEVAIGGDQEIFSSGCDTRSITTAAALHDAAEFEDSRISDSRLVMISDSSDSSG